MKKYNVGIIGYGWVASAHIPAINASPLAQVTAICSARPLDAAALSAQYGSDIAIYNNLDAMLAKAVDLFDFAIGEKIRVTHRMAIPELVTTEFDLQGTGEKPTGTATLTYEINYFTQANAPDVAL